MDDGTNCLLARREFSTEVKPDAHGKREATNEQKR
jgi:hypothetical protein